MYLPGTGIVKIFFAVFWIHISFNADPDPDPDPGFGDQNLEKISN